MNATIDAVLAEILANPSPEQGGISDDLLYRRLVQIKRIRKEMADREKRLKHESSLLTKELERRFANEDIHSIKKRIEQKTCNFALKRTPTVADPDPERTARWFDEFAPGMTRVVNRTLVSFLRDYLHDDSLGEWVHDLERLPEGLRHLKLGERLNLSLTVAS